MQPWLSKEWLLSASLGASPTRFGEEGSRDCRMENRDPVPPCQLLRTHREGPNSRAANERDEPAPLHSITSSARSKNDSEIFIPIAFAALRLTTNSSLVG